MRIYIITLLIIITSSCSRKGYPPQREEDVVPDEIINKNSRCVNLNKFSSSKRLKFYPFDKAKQIVLISFESFEMNYSIPVKDKILNYENVKESLILNENQINELTDLIYNVGYQNKDLPKIIEEGNCYEPRNGILFIDDNGNVFEYIEICFQCGRRVISSEKIKDGVYCLNKFELYKQYFRKQGIKYGTESE